MLYRLYLIEYQNKPFNEKIQNKFYEICDYLLEKNLFGVDLPEEFDAFESFIVKMKLKGILEGKSNAKTTVKRIRNRRINPFLS